MSFVQNSSWKELMGHYPVATVLLLAQKLSHSANEQAAQIGMKAMNMIENGNDFTAALSELEQFLSL